MALEELVLLLPDLVGPPSEAHDARPIKGRWPTLERWLTRADREVGDQGAHAALARYLRLASSPAGLASAALRWLGDFGGHPKGHWLCADPVHLAADLNDAVLVPGAELGIDREEAETLIATLNDHLGEEGLELHWRDPSRWYLQPDEHAEIATTPLPRVAGRPVQAFLPCGPDAGRWQRILTEVQMILHAHEVNAVREAAGRPTINGMWLWGERDLPNRPSQSWRLYGDDPVVAGLARLQGREPARATDVDAVIRDHRADQERALVWLNGESMSDWERDWFEPLDAALRVGRLKRLAVDPANGYVYRLTRRALMRFWRRPQGLAR